MNSSEPLANTYHNKELNQTGNHEEKKPHPDRFTGIRGKYQWPTAKKLQRDVHGSRLLLPVRGISESIEPFRESPGS
jgi:hypothetical protein